MKKDRKSGTSIHSNGGCHSFFNLLSQPLPRWRQVLARKFWLSTLCVICRTKNLNIPYDGRFCTFYRTNHLHANPSLSILYDVSHKHFNFDDFAHVLYGVSYKSSPYDTLDIRHPSLASFPMAASAPIINNSAASTVFFGLSETGSILLCCVTGIKQHSLARDALSFITA